MIAIKWLIATACIYCSTYVMDTVYIYSMFSAFMVAFFCGLADVLIKPVIKAVTFPLIILSFGLFTTVINGAILYYVGGYTPGILFETFKDAYMVALPISFVFFIADRFAK